MPIVIAQPMIRKQDYSNFGLPIDSTFFLVPIDYTALKYSHARTHD